VRYTLKGGGPETYEPHFTFQGFRYVAVDGYPGQLTLESLTGIVVHSDMAAAGTFETSKPLVNQLQHNIVWGQKGNFVDVPTDCPQRDERLGWMGDAQVFAPTAAFNMDVAGFFTKWLRDVAADQLETAACRTSSPTCSASPAGRRRLSGVGGRGRDHPVDDVPELRGPTHPRDAVPQHGGVGGVHAAARRRRFRVERGLHLRRLAGLREYGIGLPRSHDRQGPRCHGDVRPLDGPRAAHGARAGEGGRGGEVWHAAGAYQGGVPAEFVTATGRVGENTQTAYAVALQFDLLPEPLRAAAAARLAREVRQRKHLTTGSLARRTCATC